MNSCLAEYRYRYLQMEIFIDISELVYTHIFLFCQLRGPRSNDTWWQQAHLVPRSWFLIPFSVKGARGPQRNG